MRIMIDAGHYGKTYNQGIVKGYYESEQMWKLHLLLKTALEGYGIKVGTTRKNQNDNPGTDERGRMSKGYDLFISLHSNAVDLKLNPSGETIDRPIMLAMQDLDWTDIDDISVALSHKLGKAVQDVMETKQNYEIWQRKADTDRDQNGVLDDEYYGVLKGARLVGVPGILIEHSFHTNKAATAWLMDDNNLKRLAAAEAKTIAEYYKLTKPAAPPVTTPDVPTPPTIDFKPYIVQITTELLNVRRGAGVAFPVAGTVKKGEAFTIVEEKQVGAVTWGKLKSGAGWIGLTGYTKRLDAAPATPAVPEPPAPPKPKLKTVEEIAKEVIRGSWGAGQERVNRLTAAGYDYKTIQSTVNIMLK